jgi:hypothetical protein
MKRLAGLACAGAILLMGGPALAHHSFALFDYDKIVALTGTVKDFQWTNPHTWIQLLVPDPKTGVVVEWGIEGGSTSTMVRQGGWTGHAVKIGDKVTVYFNPMKDGSAHGSLVNVSVNGRMISPTKVTVQAR